jgi:hypothetical protein
VEQQRQLDAETAKKQMYRLHRVDERIMEIV